MLRSAGDWLRQNAPSHSKTKPHSRGFQAGKRPFLRATERPEITGVLDWESAKLGDPLTELGYLLLRWRDEGDPTPSLDTLEARYPNHDAMRELREDNENGLAPFTAKPGSPTRRELVARYEERTGFDSRTNGSTGRTRRFCSRWCGRTFIGTESSPGRNRGTTRISTTWAMLADSIIDGEFDR